MARTPAYVDAGTGPALLLGLILLAVYVWVCVRIALYAQRKGQNFVLFFVVGFLVSPLVSGVIALVVRNPLRDDLR